MRGSWWVSTKRRFCSAPTAATVPGLVTALSERELEVLALLAAGKQNQDIADELHMALNTVKKHATHIYDKLGAGNRAQAGMAAVRLGLVPPNDSAG